MIESIRKIFVEETTCQLNNIHLNLSKANVTPMTKAIAEDVFLAMHTIKGSGPMFGFENLPLMSQPVEKTFSRIKVGQIDFSPEIIEKTSDVIEIMLDALSRNSDEHLPESIKQNDLVKFFTEISH